MSRLYFLLPASLLFGCASLPYSTTPSVSSAKAPASSPAANPAPAPAPAAAEPLAKSDDAEDGACTGEACVRRCEVKGRVKDCESAGVALTAGGALKVDETRAAKYFQKSCEMKSRNSCFNLAGLLEDGKTVPHDNAKAVSLYTTACELGRGDACHLAAQRLDEGDGVPKDHKKAVALLAKGCVADDYSATACTDLRDVATKKKDAEATKALRGWKQACTSKKDATSCTGVERTAKDAL